MEIKAVNIKLISSSSNQHNNQMTSGSRMFYDLVQTIEKYTNYQEILLNLIAKYQLFAFKLQMFDCQTIKVIYEKITAKYSIIKQLQQNKISWNQNERKLFIWFIILYIHRLEQQNQTINDQHWNDISIIFFNKTVQFLKFQYYNLVKLVNKISWSPQEDSLLLKAVQQEKSGKWYEISQHVFANSNQKIFKSPKHCRQRFLNHLDSKKKRGSWTPHQDLAIFKYVIQNGKRWCKMVPVLKQIRTEHMIKNRFNSIMRKHQKNKKERQECLINKIIKILKKQVQSLQNKRKNLVNHQNENDLNHKNEESNIESSINNLIEENHEEEYHSFSRQAQIQPSQSIEKSQISDKSSQLKVNQRNQTYISENLEINNPFYPIMEQPICYPNYQSYPFQMPFNPIQYMPYNYNPIMPYYYNQPTVYNTYYY